MWRIEHHPILGDLKKQKKVLITLDGEQIEACEGEMVAAALMADGHRILRWTKKNDEPRGIFCAIGRCTDCVMIVNGVPNVRTCVTPVEDGMVIETQKGIGSWGKIE